MRILHISDLHASPEHAANQAAIVKALLRDVAELNEQTPIDLVALTGDIAFTGSAECFELAQQILLDPLQQLLSLPRERIVLVPGNHDISPLLIPPFQEQGMAETLCNAATLDALFRDLTSLQAATIRMGPWMAFHRSFYEPNLPVQAGELGWVHKLMINGESVGVAALNSAWRATGQPHDVDRGNLLVGERQARAALDIIQDCSVRLVLMHHPLEWLAPFDSNELRTSLESHGTIVLSGHDHIPDPTGEVSWRGAALYCRAGSLYADPTYRNGFYVIDTEPGDPRVVVQARTWWKDRGAFDEATDRASRGRFEWSFPSSTASRFLDLVRFSDVHAHLGQLVQRQSVIADRLAVDLPSRVSDLTVSPRCFPMPFRQAAAAARLNGGRNVERSNPLDALGKARVLIVSGDRESGVTNALLWLLEQRYDADRGRLPVYLTLTVRQGKDPLTPMLRDALISSGVPLGPHDQLPPVIAAIDDVSVTNHRMIVHLVHRFSDHPEDLYVLGCHGATHAALGQALTEAGIQFEKVFLGPFGRSELRQLVGRLGGEGDAALVGKVLSLLWAENLPRTPFIMAALVALLLRQGDLTFSSDTAILSAYVDLLLGRWELGDADQLDMDFRRREFILAALAAQLVRTKQVSLSRFDAEAFLSETLKARGWTDFSPGQLIANFIKRRVLVDDSGQVSYRHPAFRNLFAAKFLLEPSQAEFRALITGDCIANAEIVQHAAALQRTDLPLLDRVMSVALLAEKQAEDGIPTGLIDEISATGDDPDLFDPERLLEELRAASPLPRAEVDARMDRLFDQVEMFSALEFNGLDPIPNAENDFVTGVSLLSSVLRSSELVDNVARKTEALKQAIHGWSKFANWATRRAYAPNARELLRALLPHLVEYEEQLQERIARFVAGLITAVTGFAAAGSLATRALSQSVSELARDEDFMADPLHALYVMLLAKQLEVSGWPQIFQRVCERHGGHRLVWQITRSYGLWLLQDSQTSDAAVQELRGVLADALVSHSSVHGVQERSRAKSKVLTDMDQARLRAGWQSADGPGADVLDNEHIDE